MPLTFRWVEDDERDRVAVTRMRPTPASKDLPRFQERIRTDPRVKAGDFLLAELDGEPVGTSTSLSLTTWVRRGGLVPGGGVCGHDPLAPPGRLGRSAGHRHADHERNAPSGPGAEPVGLVPLMPFRNSFYERFGYGVVERRHDWVIPTPLLPAGDTDGLRHYRSTDLEALAVCRQKQVCRGQCDIKRTKESWINLIGQFEDGHFSSTAPNPMARFAVTSISKRSSAPTAAGNWLLKSWATKTRPHY